MSAPANETTPKTEKNEMKSRAIIERVINVYSFPDLPAS
jgi:hypothetical protein